MTTHPLFDHELIIKGHRVWADGEVLKLSARGHQALIMLLESNGRVLSKDELIAQLWQGVVVSDDSLFKVIQEVRQSLKHLGVDEPVVLNVYGKGYQWQVPSDPGSTTPAGVRPRWWLWTLPVLLAIALVWQLSRPTPTVTTDDWFARQVSLIESGATPDWTVADEASVDHPLDQLKKAYLQGLYHHQSGQYDRSIQSLSRGLEVYRHEPVHPVQADSHYLLARMYIYRDDRQTLKHHLDEAERLYQLLGDEFALLDVAIERARYHQVLLEFEHSVELLHEVLEQALERQDAHHQLRALSNLAYAHQQLHQPQQREVVLLQTLELALARADGRYAAYAYGELAEIYAAERDYPKAMAHAERALRYVLNQHNTNVFQQGFSAFYLLLRPVGHTRLAERYLLQAIEVQRGFNDQGVLVNAELNLAKVYISQGHWQRGLDLLKSLLAESLTGVEQLETEALLAFISQRLGDNISAYTRSRPVLDSDAANRQALLYARAAFVLSAWQLERNVEAAEALTEMADWVEPADLDELRVFLEVAEVTADELGLTDWPPATRAKAANELAARAQQLKEQTRPDEQLLQDLNRYLQRISAH